MTRARTAAGLAVGLVCWSCTRPNPAYWLVVGGDAEVISQPLSPDAAAAPEPDAAFAALDTADQPVDVSPAADQALAADLPPTGASTTATRAIAPSTAWLSAGRPGP